MKTPVQTQTFNSGYALSTDFCDCPEKPQYLCLEKNCPHLAYCDAEKGDYLFLNKKYKKKK